MGTDLFFENGDRFIFWSAGASLHDPASDDLPDFFGKVIGSRQLPSVGGLSNELPLAIRDRVVQELAVSHTPLDVGRTERQICGVEIEPVAGAAAQSETTA